MTLHKMVSVREKTSYRCVCVCVHMTYIHEASHGNRSGRRFVQIITLNKMKERSTRIRERKGHEEVPFQHFGMNNFPST